MLDYKVRTYYHAKSFIPRRVQILLRRELVKRQLRQSAGVWPIYEAAKKPPRGWTGWPDDKKFALVLTHDVDTQRGLDNCLRLADIEESLGFRSVFNFVARKYVTPLSVREALAARGFEIGLHGLYHNSLLFHSREEFLRQAPEINRVLEEWNVVGFRSPCMYHNLEWMHDLKIAYDASTFDTDPFEPQPDGVHTIFPSYIPGPGAEKKGYVELPYTLPQDFTLFVLMRERTTRIWKSKTDWVVRNGGMLLLNTHPDYMSFNGRVDPYSQYEASLYREFLEHIRDVYRGQYWHPLPREIARFWGTRGGAISADAPPARPQGLKSVDRGHRDSNPAPAPSVPANGAAKGFASAIHRNICMIAYTFYEMDTRVRQYAEALAERGDRVDVIALRHNTAARYEVIRGVHVYRIQDRTRNEGSRLAYLSRLLRFLARSTAFVTKRHLRARYDLVHVHSVPDFEVFAALIPKLMGARIILDIHDIVPEFYASKFGIDRASLVYGALKFLEKISARFSDHVIIANHIWEKTLRDRSVKDGRCTTFLNYPDPTIFHRRSGGHKNGGPLIIYPGSLNRHQGLDIALKAFALARRKLPEAQFHIYGGGPEEASLKRLARDLALDGSVRFHGFLQSERIAPVMAQATIAVVPKRNDSFGGEAFSTKVFEFMALGVPIILSRTKVDDFYFDDSLVHFFEPENYMELAEALVLLATDENRRKGLAKSAAEFIGPLRWDKKKYDYYSLVDGLLA